jgi:transposase-like protein
MIESTSASAGAAKTNGIGGPPPIDGQRRQFSDEFKRGIVARVKKGEVAGALANKLKISGSVIRRWVAQAGVVRKGKPVRRKGVSVSAGGRTVYSEDFKRAAVKRLKDGESPIQLADELKIHNSMLYNWAKKLGGAAAATGSKYDAKFKAAALKRYHAGESAADIAKDLKLAPHAVYDWDSRAKKLAAKATSPTGNGNAVAAGGNGVKAAISFLKHARDEMHEALRRGEIKEFDQAHLLSQLALNALLKSA